MVGVTTQENTNVRLWPKVLHLHFLAKMGGGGVQVGGGGVKVGGGGGSN